MVRQFFYSAFADLYWRAMMRSRDATLAAIAAKSEKESAYHLRHSSEWIVRLGDGTDESHARAQAAIDDLWAFTGEMFEADAGERALIDAGIAVDPASLRPQWLKTVSGVVSEATLALPRSDWMQQGGRDGRHSEHLGHLLSELQSMQRTFPGADMVTRCIQRCRVAAARVGHRGDRGRSGNSGADHRRSRRAARRRDQATARSRSRSRRPIPAAPR